MSTIQLFAKKFAHTCPTQTQMLLCFLLTLTLFLRYSYACLLHQVRFLMCFGFLHDQSLEAWWLEIAILFAHNSVDWEFRQGTSWKIHAPPCWRLQLRWLSQLGSLIGTIYLGPWVCCQLRSSLFHLGLSPLMLRLPHSMEPGFQVAFL